MAQKQLEAAQAFLRGARSLGYRDIRVKQAAGGKKSLSKVHRCHRPLVYFLGKVVVCLSHTREISTCGVFHGEGENGTCVWPLLHYDVAVNWIDDGIAFLCGFKTPAKFKHT